MRLVLLTHPPSLASASMPRFAGMISKGMTERGHHVKCWTSENHFTRLPVHSLFVRKWLGYADQFLLYPRKLRQLVEQQSADTLFVVTDQALSMWLPNFAHRPHVIHCHDFLALRSAQGEFCEHGTRWSGRRYQQLIQNGFSLGKAFISVSKNTQQDLHRFLPNEPKISDVVYNGFNHPFRRMNFAESISLLNRARLDVPETGMICHVGGNQWYKNRKGVLGIYRVYASIFSNPPELWMIGQAPNKELSQLAATCQHPGKIRFISGLTNEQVNAVYSQAEALLFPSLEEGFGWPVAEAMASGCPVITTDIAPLTEVAGDAAFLIPRMPTTKVELSKWEISAAETLNKVVHLPDHEREEICRLGMANAKRFDTSKALESYEKIYSLVLFSNTKTVRDFQSAAA